MGVSCVLISLILTKGKDSISAFYRWENWGTEILSHWLKVSQPVSSLAGIYQSGSTAHRLNLHPACVPAKSLQSCLTFCDLMDCSLPGSSVHGSLQARRLDWVAMPSSRGSSQPKYWTCISCVGRSHHRGNWILGMKPLAIVFQARQKKKCCIAATTVWRLIVWNQVIVK